MPMDKRITDAVRERASDGRLPCAAALALAETLGVPPSQVGRAADDLGIKIAACQLGCFGNRRTEEPSE